MQKSETRRFLEEQFEKYEQAIAKSDGQSPTSTEKEKGNESS